MKAQLNKRVPTARNIHMHATHDNDNNNDNNDHNNVLELEARQREALHGKAQQGKARQGKACARDLCNAKVISQTSCRCTRAAYYHKIFAGFLTRNEDERYNDLLNFLRFAVCNKHL